MGKKIQGREFERRMKCISLNKAGSGVIYCGGHTPQDVKDTAINIAKEADARIAALEAERDRLREALEHSVQMHEARAEWIRETALKWNGLSVITGRSARAHLLARAADDENATAELCRQALQPKEQSSADAQEARE